MENIVWQFADPKTIVIIMIDTLPLLFYFKYSKCDKENKTQKNKNKPYIYVL